MHKNHPHFHRGCKNPKFQKDILNFGGARLTLLGGASGKPFLPERVIF